MRAQVASFQKPPQTCSGRVIEPSAILAELFAGAPEAVAAIEPAAAPSREADSAQEELRERSARALPHDLTAELSTALQAHRTAAVTKAAADSGTWTERGSSTVAGRTQVTAVAPDQSLLVGTAGGSVFAGSPQGGWQV
ncbi:MAG TPA: hypothetical protein VGE98_16160, partial [Thermoanaerobaculia bacterium]